MGDRAEWRAHLAACAECDAHYRETVEMLSRLHRARKEGFAARSGSERAAPARDEQPELPQRGSLISFCVRPRPSGWRAPKRAQWLGWTIPLVALGIFAAVGMSGSDPRRTTAEALAGEVEAGGHLLARGDAPRELEKGAKVVAAADASVRIADAQTELTLRGAGALALEGLAPLRVRLYGGRLDARGPCTVSTALGVLAAPGGALTLELDERGLSARASAEGASFQDGHGRRALAPGEPLVFVTPLAPDAH